MFRPITAIDSRYLAENASDDFWTSFCNMQEVLTKYKNIDNLPVSYTIINSGHEKNLEGFDKNYLMKNNDILFINYSIYNGTDRDFLRITNILDDIPGLVLRGNYNVDIVYEFDYCLVHYLEDIQKKLLPDNTIIKYMKLVADSVD